MMATRSFVAIVPRHRSCSLAHLRSPITKQCRSFMWGQRRSDNTHTNQSSFFRSQHRNISTTVVAGPDGIPSRSDQLDRLDANDTPYDILVIGGGITGCGIALDAASRGLSVACVERGDFGSETSSRSTKLVWAGIRYMATAVATVLNQPLSKWWSEPTTIYNNLCGELRMVQNCHRERKYMLERQAHLTHWMPIAVPFTSYIWASKRDEKQPPPFGNSLFQLFPLVAPIVFKVYDSLSSFTCPSSYSFSSPTSTAATTLFPNLRYYTSDPQQRYIRYVSVFYEAMHNDARTNLAVALTAAEQGAVMCNYVQATQLLHHHTDGRVTGARVQDTLTGREWTVHAKHVVVAAGPFTDAVRALDGTTTTTTTKPAVRGGSGTHIVLGPHVLSGKGGVLDYNTSDGRFLFILPWLGHTLVGTTDRACTAQTRHDPPEEEIGWLLNEAQTYLQLDAPLERSDVLSAWRGWRPLAVDPHQQEGPASRDHIISENPETGLVFIAGGKWTTWREMAQEVVDRLYAATTCTTLDIVLHGGAGGAQATPQSLQEEFQLDPDIAEHLVATYGTRAKEVLNTTTAATANERLVPEFPYIEREVVYACREYACTVEDILSRRTRLAFLNIRAAQQAVPRVTELMGQTLGWSKKERQEQQRLAEEFLESFGGPETKK